jgi:hypothetical protein
MPMSRAYHHPIQVTLVDGKPVTLCWRKITYRVLHRNEPWHLLDRWWEQAGEPGSGTGRSDRTYYRLHCASAHSELTCEIYFEAVSSMWILERVYD